MDASVKKDDKRRQEAALSFERIIGSLDKAAKSPIAELYNMQESLGKTRASITRDLGGSSKLFKMSLTQAAEVAQKRFSKRLQDITKVMENQISNLEDTDPSLIGVALDEASKHISDATQQLVASFQAATQAF